MLPSICSEQFAGSTTALARSGVTRGEATCHTRKGGIRLTTTLLLSDETGSPSTDVLSGDMDERDEAEARDPTPYPDAWQAGLAAGVGVLLAFAWTFAIAAGHICDPANPDERDGVRESVCHGLNHSPLWWLVALAIPPLLVAGAARAARRQQRPGIFHAVWLLLGLGLLGFIGAGTSN
jgi:hypothetical protein